MPLASTSICLFSPESSLGLCHFGGFVPPMIPERRQLRFLEVQEKREQLVDDFTPHPDHLGGIEASHALPRDDPALGVYHHDIGIVARLGRRALSLPEFSQLRVRDAQAAPSSSPCWPRPTAPFFRSPSRSPGLRGAGRSMPNARFPPPV